jgi:hypothetical protein
METFHGLIEDQFAYGGQKYALNGERESTDELFDRYTKSWLAGTMDKYTFRYRNLKRERDLLKIACYCYILWLKKGFFIKSEGLRYDVLDTVVAVKKANFPLFKERVNDFLKFDAEIIDVFVSRDDKIIYISELIRSISIKEWADLSEYTLFKIYTLTYLLWKEEFGNTTKHDTDTYGRNESSTQ